MHETHWFSTIDVQYWVSSVVSHDRIAHECCPIVIDSIEGEDIEADVIKTIDTKLEYLGEIPSEVGIREGLEVGWTACVHPCLRSLVFDDKCNKPEEVDTKMEKEKESIRTSRKDFVCFTQGLLKVLNCTFPLKCI